MDEDNRDLEHLDLTSLLKPSSASGEEEILKTASDFTLQISAVQIKTLSLLNWLSTFMQGEKQKRLQSFVKEWLEFKKFNNSTQFIRGIIGDMAMKKFINENSIKVNVEKNK